MRPQCDCARCALNRRLGLAQSEHYFSSVPGSWYNSSALLDVDPVVMSWTRGDTRGKRAGDISNTFLTRAEADLLAAGRAAGALFARKFHLEADAPVLDLIDAGLPGVAEPSEAALAISRKRAAAPSSRKSSSAARRFELK